MDGMDELPQDVVVEKIEQVPVLELTGIKANDARRELLYNDNIEGQDLGGVFIDEQLILGRFTNTKELALRVPGCGVFRFGPDSIPQEFLSHIISGVFMGYMAIMSDGLRSPVYHFQDNTTRIFKYKFDGCDRYLGNIDTIFDIPSTNQPGTIEPGITVDDAINLPATVTRSKSRGALK